MTAVRAGDERICYFRDDGRILSLPESELEPPGPDPRDLASFFKTFQWGTPRDFYARFTFMQTIARWHEASDGLPAFLGARVRHFGHQIYAARRVLTDRVPRFILADEVGLGKTIEACLVLQALLARDPKMSVLVIAPGSMSRQWLTEIYLRFGARPFTHLAAGKSGRVSPAEQRRLLRARQIIVSTTALLETPGLRRTLAEREWDLVVIDEVHRILADHEVFAWVQNLSERTKGVLALSATPSKRDVAGLLDLLRLVAPDVYAEKGEGHLQQRLAERREIWARLNTTAEILEACRQSSEWPPQEEIIDHVCQDWRSLLAGEPEVERLLAGARQGRPEALEDLVAYVQEYYRVDHRIIRTRRRTLDQLGTRFARRQLQVLPYEPDVSESLLADALEHLPLPDRPGLAQQTLRLIYHRMASTTPDLCGELLGHRAAALALGPQGDAEAIARALASDPGAHEEGELLRDLLRATPPLPDERRWLESARGLVREWGRHKVCARHQALLVYLQQLLAEDRTCKVLVFTQEREVVGSLVETLQPWFPRGAVAGFHHELENSQQEEVALAFQRSPALRILVSDESGGEGRNFQIATQVVHLDTPVAIGRLEQRIGRLDRLGRAEDRPVVSVVLQGPGSAERTLQRVHTTIFEVYTGSIGGLEFVLPWLQARLCEGLGRGTDVEEWVSSLRETVSAARTAVNQDFERSLDSTLDQLQQAKSLCEVLTEENDKGASNAVTHWLSALGIQRYVENGHLGFRWKHDSLDEKLPGFPESSAGNAQGTFDRTEALGNESLQFFGPGHRLVDAAVATLATSTKGRATILARRLGPAHQRRMFLLLVAAVEVEVTPVDGQSVSVGLQIRAHRYLSPEALTCCLSIDPDASERIRVVHDLELEKALQRVYRREDGDQEMDSLQGSGADEFRSLWPAIDEAVTAGIAFIREKRAAIHADARERLAEEMRAEMGYFRGVLGRGETDEIESARRELALRERLLQGVAQARVEPCAVALVVGI
ncbi:SNF2-related protein [Nannocystis pusilla]|uniref:SNF2-related protein n=1 Tax=Nannocystis pusilla TaxID=889268 RepID=UPI003BF1BC37